MDQRLIILVIIVVLILGFVLMHSVFEPFKESQMFTSGDKFLAINTTGDIVLKSASVE